MDAIFNGSEAAETIVGWIRSWFEENGKDCRAVIGISGGKDSSVTAALCVRALGAERVLGVLMPQGIQPDIQEARRLVEILGISSITIDVEDACAAVLKEVIPGLSGQGIPLSQQTKINLPPRIRMTALYAVAQSVNGRVANTCNLSEDWVGYSTRYGDGAGDFAPLAELTVTEVKTLGYALGLPADLVEKVPGDGLCGKSDEENLGFSYEQLDGYIRTGICTDCEIKERIDRLHEKNAFKLQPMPKAVLG